ncbi:hypothetical protein A3H38_00025 [candidate division WOR-1 bacterium RIFCSPLOWO2_02_FULL_46_20]|uniref:Glycosyltransferase RgtA/B/C/D-like domain-containing protein n=2 Tax=Saganbacteria TaxID=1703751 RepID=A0A1F4R8C2_UNCSA|nr:MAG: hypothetical protein A3J44_02110 [candidate division WOR-1 bacterium RIFCSPHIGHO2_02_FULL_45_12]OGC04409.1 MAG: hypothetical protein A3H38_00025 [candidate division WOR-1 bacterium RIFCSPLOWO2_02_FULL_46_20]OGC08744.1 MAG: hypothetical protein A3F86_05200 [candidate division WOR-1 bacterium RIFCSPLOWO2_12_FULL_45_9]
MNKKLILTLIVLASILFFFKLGSFSLYDAAETTYGEFIKQIRLTGDWVTMHYNGEIVFDKPPLYFWLATLATYIFGFNEFALRFWAALCGVLTVAATYFLGKSFYDQRVGWLAGIIALTSFQFLIQSRIAELDILLTLLITLTFLFFWLGYQSNNSKYYLVCYAAAGLATLVKGLLGIALPGFAIFLFLLFRGGVPRLKEIKIIPGALILLTIATPWYAAEWFLHGQRFTEFVLGFLFLSRFQGVVAGHPGPWYYYLLALILGFAPWSHFLPLALTRTWKNRVGQVELLSLCYIVPVIFVFSIAQTKLPNYMLPLYPFLAIMVAKLWDDILSESANKLRGPFMLSNLAFAGVVAMIIIGFALLGTANYAGQYEELMPNLLVLATILGIGALCSAICALWSKFKMSFYAIPIMVFALAFVLTTQTLPAVEKYKGTKELAQEVTQNIKENQTIAAYNTGNRPGIVFYSSKPVVYLKNEQEFKTFLKEKKGYVFTTDDKENLVLLR